MSTTDQPPMPPDPSACAGAPTAEDMAAIERAGMVREATRKAEKRRIEQEALSPILPGSEVLSAPADLAREAIGRLGGVEWIVQQARHYPREVLACLIRMLLSPAPQPQAAPGGPGYDLSAGTNLLEAVARIGDHVDPDPDYEPDGTGSGPVAGSPLGPVPSADR